MEINPTEELVFQKTTGNTNPKQTITIKNTYADSHIVFKVKTTAPKQFCVRPNAGKLAPGEKCEVSLTLQLKEGATFDLKRKDKFLVQSIRVPASALDEMSSGKVAELWSHAEQIRKSIPDVSDYDAIMEKKLRCVYVLDSAEQPRPVSLTPSLPIERASVYNFAESDAKPSTPLLQGICVLNAEQAPSLPLTIPVTSVTTDSSSQKEVKELKDRIGILQAACDGYKQELERVNLLRQRRADSTLPTSTSTVISSKQKIRPIGLDIQVVAILCLVSFLLGIWLF